MGTTLSVSTSRSRTRPAKNKGSLDQTNYLKEVIMSNDFAHRMSLTVLAAFLVSALVVSCGPEFEPAYAGSTPSIATRTGAHHASAA